MPTEQPCSGTCCSSKKVPSSSAVLLVPAGNASSYVVQSEMFRELYLTYSSFWCSCRSHSSCLLTPPSSKEWRQYTRVVCGHPSLYCAIVLTTRSSFARNWRCTRTQWHATEVQHRWKQRRLDPASKTRLLPFFCLLRFSREKPRRRKS